MDGAPRRARRAGLQHPGRRGVLGPYQSPGLAHLRAQPARCQLARVCPGALLAAREHSGGVGSDLPPRARTRAAGVLTRRAGRVSSPGTLEASSVFHARMIELPADLAAREVTRS